MDETFNRGYPYPVCDPPLQKDASDIIQFAQLAEAINTDVQALADTVESQMSFPPCGRMELAAQTTTLDEWVAVYTSSGWSTRPGMTDVSRGGFVIQEPGWYLITGYVKGPSTFIRTRLVVNNIQHGVWQGYTRSVTGISDNVQQLKVTIFLNAGDFVTTVVRHSTVGSITFSAQLALTSVVSGA